MLATVRSPRARVSLLLRALQLLVVAVLPCAPALAQNGIQVTLRSKSGSFNMSRGKAIVITADTTFSPGCSGDHAKYAWSLDNKPLSAQGHDIAVALSAPGDHGLTCQVTTDTCSGSGSHGVHVTPDAGTGGGGGGGGCTYVAYASPTSACVGTPIQFEGHIQENYGGCNYNPYWVFDDDLGTSYPGNTVSHAFSTAGSHTGYFYSGGLVAQVQVTITNDTVSGVSISANPNPACTGSPVNFSASANQTCSTTVTFTWNFGDGGTGTGQSVTHAYSAAGSYSVQVTASNGGSSASAQTTEKIDAPGVSTVTGSGTPNPSCPGQSMQFTASAEAPCASGISYSWNFGDGSSGSGNPVNHTYAAGGTYTVQVTATASGSSASFQFTQQVKTGISNLNASGSPNPACVGSSVLFSASASDPCGSGTITYSWAFGDGGTGSGASPTHTYGAAGSYTVQVTASDSSGSVSTSFTESVSSGPSGAPGGVSASASGTTITVTWGAVSGSTSYNVYRSTGGGSYSKVGSSSGTSYTDSGLAANTNYCYKVSAVSGCGEGSQGGSACATTGCDSSGSIFIHGVFNTPNPAAVNAPVTFDCDAYDFCNNSLTYNWTFGDGGSGSGSRVTHSYSAPGTYTARVTVSNGTQSITVSVDETVMWGKQNTPGIPPGDSQLLIPMGCNCEHKGGTCVYLNAKTGDIITKTVDPVPTRGWPLANDIHLNSQYVAGDGSLLNGTFTYDIHVTTGPVYDNFCHATAHWFLVDGDGTRLDFGPTSGALVPPPGVFSQLAAITGGGWVLQNAGAPESIGEAGNFTYWFNSAGLLTEILDPAKNAQMVTYGGTAPTVRTVLDVSTGKSLLFQSVAGGPIDKIVENGGQSVTTIEYSSGGISAIVIRDAAGNEVTSSHFGYQWVGARLQLASMYQDHDLSSEVDFAATQYPSLDCDANDSVGYTYGSPGGPPMVNYQAAVSLGAAYTYTVTNHKGGTTVYDFNQSGDIFRVTAPKLSGATANTVYNLGYDGQHQLTSASDGTLTDTLSYAANGLPSALTTPEGVWTFNWTGASSADLQQAQDPLAHLFNLTYGDTAQPNVPTSFRDAAAQTWNLVHNSHGQITQITPPAGSPTGPVTVTYDETPNSSTLGYPLQIATANNLEKVTFNQYDLLGDLLSVSSYPDGVNPISTQFSYDAAQRLTSVLLPDGRSVQYVYNGRNLDHVTDPAGTQLFFNWCAPCGLLTDVSGPVGWALHWSFDQDHDLTSFTDARGWSTYYSYGSAGELTRITYPDATTLQAQYYQNGLPDQVINGRNQQLFLGYDTSERLTNVTSPDTNLAFHYNNDDSLQNFTDGMGATSVSYDSAGRVQSVSYNYTNLPAVQTLSYTYNSDGSRASMTWTSGGTTVGTWYWGYDAAGRLTSVRNPWSETTTWNYDGEGKIQSQIDSNGTSLSIGYNQLRGWPTSLTWNHGQTALARYNLAYDGGNNTIGNLTGVSELDGSTVQYGYDLLYRLTSDSRSGTNPTANSYQYDLAGNRTQVSVPGATTNYTFDSANKLISSSAGGTVSYDADGNMLAESFGNLPQHWSMQWNTRGNLTAADSNQFGYDALGRCVYLNLPSVGPQSFGGPAGQRFLIYDGSLVIGEVALNGSQPQLYSAYTWGATGLVSERLIQQNRSLFYHFGPQGETRQLTDSGGNIADTYSFTGYGVPGPSTGSDYNPFQYGGQVGYYTPQGSTTDLILCGARWYSPAQGRWTSRDPVDYDGGPNLYEYCDSDPVNGSDPDGTLPIIGYIGGDFRFLRRKAMRAKVDPDIAAEIAVAKYYRAKGRQVRFVPEGTTRTSDLIIDGRKVDVRRITTPNKKGVLAKVLDKETQAEIIVLDVREAEAAGLNAKSLCRVGAEARKVSSKISAVKILGAEELGRMNVNFLVADLVMTERPKSRWQEFLGYVKAAGIVTGTYDDSGPMVEWTIKWLRRHGYR